VKVVPVAKNHDIKVYVERGGKAPHILILGTMWGSTSIGTQ